MSGSIVSAGGVVWRALAVNASQIEVLLVHHTRHNDWGFPKGRVEARETYEQAALREVREETGYRCRLEKELTVLHYNDRNGRAKKVYFWSMIPIDREPISSTEEIDATQWVSLEEAEKLLASRPQETFLLGALTSLFSTTRPQQGRV